MENYLVYEGRLIPESELMHHGIKGMKWGVRRYQNPDGSLTDAGRKRYGYGKLDIEGKAKYNQYRKNNADTVAQSGIGSTMLGAVGGAVAGGLAAGPVGAYVGAVGSAVLSGLTATAISAGRAFIDNHQYKKALIKQADAKRDAEDSAKKSVKYQADQEKITKLNKQDVEKFNKLSSEDQDKKAMAAAKKAGLDQGDNWKVYRQAMSGNEKAQKVVEEWESGSSSSGSVKDKVSTARKTGKYDMEFLERNLDQDAAGNNLEGKALDAAYEKYLKEKYRK